MAGTANISRRLFALAGPRQNPMSAGQLLIFMKVAMIGQKGYPALSGGIETHVQELSERLVNQGHEVIVFCRGWYSKKNAYNGKVQRVFVPTIRTKHLDAIVHTFLSTFVAVWMKADVFHYHGVGPALLVWLPKLLRPSAKIVVTFHSIDRLQQKWGWFARLMLRLGELAACRLPDKTIVVSKTLLEYARETYGADPIYIPNGVNILDKENKNELIKKFDLETNKYFIMVSRLVEHKGQKTLIEAWKKARAAQPKLFRDLKLVIVGGGSFTDDYVKEVKKISCGDNSIVLTGEQTGEILQALFANAYAAVHPSRLEGLPIAVLEAMSYGKCVLASDIPEHLEITHNHGLAFKVGDTDDLAKNLIMMAEAPELVDHVGTEAVVFVKNNFSWNEIAERTEMLYRQIIHLKKENPVMTWLTRRKPLL